MNDRRIALRFLVSGTVQGVGYRFFAQRAAARLGVAGYAKNLRDGRVEVYAIGTETSLSDLRRELQRGPAASSVSGVTAQSAEIEPQSAADFSIEYDD